MQDPSLEPVVTCPMKQDLQLSFWSSFLLFAAARGDHPVVDATLTWSYSALGTLSSTYLTQITVGPRLLPQNHGGDMIHQL